MMLRLAGIVLTGALLLAAVRGAEAKMPSYVLAGGELGPYAYQFSALISEGDDPFSGFLLDEHSQAVEPPGQLPSLAYDLYRSYGPFHVAAQVVNGGPELRYYPELQLLYARESDRWYRPGAEAVRFVERAIEDALAKATAGELEEGPVAADLVGRRLTEVSYWMRAYTRMASNNTAPDLSECRDCTRVIAPIGEFIIRHVVETVSRPLYGTTSEPPAFVIEYEGIVEPPYGGIGGLFGFYTPPTDDHGGRFWPGGHSSDTPYYETTAGFDAAFADAVVRAQALADTDQANERTGTASAASDAPSAATFFGAAVAVAVSMGIAGTLYAYARRRRRT